MGIDAEGIEAAALLLGIASKDYAERWAAAREARRTAEEKEQEAQERRPGVALLFDTLLHLGADPEEVAIARESYFDHDPPGHVSTYGILRSIDTPRWRDESRLRSEEAARFKAAMEGAKLESADDLRAVLAKLEPETPVAQPEAPAAIVPKPKRKYVRRVKPAPVKASRTAKAPKRKPARRW